jgi:RimJ/RimL family protein N-acetyltransferase
MNPQPFILKDGRRVTLRLAAPEDAEAMIAFVQTVDAETRFLAREQGEFSMTARQEHEFIVTWQKEKRALWLVAESDGQIVAACNVQPLRNMQRFRHRAMFALSVRRAYWRQGIGRCMMIEALRWCRETGYEQAELTVVAGNTAAIALYESLGFERAGVYKNALKYSDGTYADEYFMYLPLTTR